MIRNIIFDIGNVLADFRWREFLADQGFSEEMVERIGRASVLGPYWIELDRGVWSYEKILQSFVDRDPEIQEELRRALGNISGIVTLREYAISWMEQLKAKGYRLYYLSNFGEKPEIECEDALAFLPYMDGGILSWKEKLVKPDPAIYLLLLERYGLEAKECVFLDDTLQNVEAAEQLGIRGIHFRSPGQALQELQNILNCGTLHW